MQFDNSHYTRDWDLLAGVAAEWAALRARFNLGSKATREQIEEHWDAIFNADRAEWPNIRRVHSELMRDEALLRHFRKCYWHELKAWERSGYTFAEVISVGLTRIFWQVVRNAYAWLPFKGELVHWARFWTTENLTEELRRAIHDRDESERSQGTQLRRSRKDDGRTTQELEVDYQGRRAEQPGRALERFEEEKDLARDIRKDCSDAEASLIEDLLNNVRDFTEDEMKRLKAIARRIAQKVNLRKQ